MYTQSYNNSEESSMKVVVAIDSFKGSLSSIKAGNAVQKGILAAHPDARVVVKPLADGGEGTTDALIEGMHGELIALTVTGSMHTLVDAKDPFLATSYGIGEMINDALSRGCKSIILGIGGSATNNGGIGMLKALGVRFLQRSSPLPEAQPGKPPSATGEGIDAFFPILSEVTSLAQAMDSLTARKNLTATAEQVFRLLN